MNTTTNLTDAQAVEACRAALDELNAASIRAYEILRNAIVSLPDNQLAHEMGELYKKISYNFVETNKFFNRTIEPLARN